MSNSFLSLKLVAGYALFYTTFRWFRIREKGIDASFSFSITAATRFCNSKLYLLQRIKMVSPCAAMECCCIFMDVV